MARKLTSRLNRSNNLWWITGGVAGLFVLCAGGMIIFRSFFPAAGPTALPEVPAFQFNTSTPAPAFATVTGFPTSTSSSSGVVATITSLPAATPTNSSIFNWIFRNFVSSSQPTASTFRSPTPIQVIVVTATPVTPAATTLPPPPTQGAPNPIVCKNILYPARPGNQWTYFINTPRRSGDVNIRVITVEGTQATIDATEVNVGTTVRSSMQCEQDIILSFPVLSVQKLIGEVVNGSVNADYVGGVLAPNEAAFLSSNWALSWVSQYRVYGDGSLTFNGSNFNFSLSPSIVTMTCQTLASGDASFENITVAAGTFRALKVICRGEGQALATVNGSQVTGTVTAQATQWFAPNVGLLKSQSDFVFLNVFGVSLPLSSSDVAGFMELKSYSVGQ
jgi:hypothetical protein